MGNVTSSQATLLAATGVSNLEVPDEKAHATMEQVMVELKKLFNEKNEKTLEDADSWLMLDENYPIDDFVLTANQDLEELNNGDSLHTTSTETQSIVPSVKKKKGETRATTFAWMNNAQSALSFVSYLWPQNDVNNNSLQGDNNGINTALPSVPSSEDLLTVQKRLQDHVMQMEQMKEQINWLQQSLLQQPAALSFAPSSTTSSTAHSQQPAVHTTPNLTTSFIENYEEDGSSAPSPPPPPPLSSSPAPSSLSIASGNMPGKIAIGSVNFKKKEKLPKTREQLLKELRELISQSDVLPVNREKAVVNFMNAFPPQANSVLEQIVTDYPALVRSCALKPQTCFKRFKLWEKYLFKRLSDDKTRQALRHKKNYEIEKIESEEQILAEIQRIFKFLELEKQKEEQRRKEKEREQAMGSVVGELKNLIQQKETKDTAEKALQELQEMESGPIVMEEDL